jgi:microcystin degradation protein MlrC
VCRAKAAGEADPVMAVHDCRMINSWHTTAEPMASFVARMQAAEKEDGIMSVSFAHGFPWGDVPCATARMIVIADGDRAKATALAETLGREIWELRGQTGLTTAPLNEALDRAIAARQGPVVLADVADNAGGGAPSDSTFVLHALLERGVTNFASGLYWDPLAIRFCKEAGEGAEIELRIGGKCCAASGDPVDLRVTVERIIEDAAQPFGEVTMPIGDAVWVQAPGNVDLVLTSLRTQTFHPDAFSQMGIELAAKKIVVVKSSQHFHAGFAPIAGEIVYAASPGTLNTDFANIDYQKNTTPYWPKVADPFAKG